MKDLYVYDIEILGGNFFCSTFINPKTNEKLVCYVLNGVAHNTHILFDIIPKCILIGYNNKSYDDIILNYIWTNKEVVTSELYALSNDIIKNQNSGEPLWKNDDLKPFLKGKVESIDLMKILAFDKLKVSLKQCAVNLRHPLILDMPIDHKLYVQEKDLDLILNYNLNDVNITLTLLNKLKPDINLRFKTSYDYKVNVKDASRTAIGKEIFNKYYSDYTGLEYEQFKDLRTPRSYIQLRECILPGIHYKTNIMNTMLDYFKSKTVYSIDEGIDYLILFNNKGYQMGFGGLHSIDRPAIYTSTEDCIILDADVGSYYPNILIQYGIKPEHCSDVFLQILTDITDRRLQAKAKKDMITADTLKITINAVFGLFNYPKYWLYDPKAALTTTINGQMFLLMLIEDLELNGFEVISANTDGVTTMVDKNNLEKYNKICKAWEDYTKFNLEFKQYNKYVRRDVNNYSVEVKDDDQKTKGIFSEKQILEKGYNTAIIPKALNNYFFKGIPIQDTISNGDNIFDYCLSEKSGNQFKMELHYLDGLDKKVLPLQKTNRYFIANKGGTFLKRKQDDSLINMQVGWQVYILNDFNKDKDYLSNIDKRYYINECNKTIEIIEDKQLKLW